MKSKLKHYLKEIISFFVLIILFANAISLYKSQSLNKNSFNLQTLQLINKHTYNLPTNKPILIHFWATWCPTCKIESSNIQFISQHFEVLSIAVNSNSDTEIQRYLDAHNYTFNVVNDKDHSIASEANIIGLPTTFIYNKNQEVVFTDVGYTSTFILYMKMLWATYL